VSRWGGRKRSRRPASTATAATSGQTYLMPFGKWSGTPVQDVLVADRAYCTWLCAQPWFRNDYPQLHALFSQNGAAPRATPAHNAMQLRYLDDRWCLRLALMLDPPSFRYDGPEPPLQAYGQHRYAIVNRELEAQAGGGWWDVRFQLYVPPLLSERVLVELKTSIGDEWPEVLRQVKRRNQGEDRFDRAGGPMACVVVRSWDSTNHWASVAQAFQSEHITLISEAWIGAV